MPAPNRHTLLALAAAAITAGCGSDAPASGTSGPLQIVAAENFWGSIAAQLGGADAQVKSIIVNPNTDPHSYEPTAQDARTMATAQMAIVNGIGYDQWASQLLAASPDPSRTTLNVGSLTGLTSGDNPHQWYDPRVVQRVIDQITADYTKLRPHDAAYFAQKQKAFETTGLTSYHTLIASIRKRFAGTPVGASESIFVPMANALGLSLLTPYSFTKAVAEGTDPTAAAKETADRQITDHRIKVWVFNSQNSTPDVQRLTSAAAAAKIPITTVTETLSPASDSFEQWQVDELRRLAAALTKATAR